MIESHRTMEQARRDYGAGLLKQALLVRVPMQAHAWQLRLEGKRGEVGLLLDVATLVPTTFTSLDQAVAALEQIGFACTQLTPK